MSMSKKFETLVRNLDRETLDDLRLTVASEIGGRRQKSAIKVEDIHPGMTPTQRDQATEEIARVLRGED
jgi:hypothetical protein